MPLPFQSISLSELLFYSLWIWCSNGRSDPLIVQKIQTGMSFFFLEKKHEWVNLHRTWNSYFLTLPNLARIACNLPSICFDLRLFEAWPELGCSAKAKSSPLLLSKVGGSNSRELPHQLLSVKRLIRFLVGWRPFAWVKPGYSSLEQKIIGDVGDYRSLIHYN